MRKVYLSEIIETVLEILSITFRKLWYVQINITKKIADVFQILFLNSTYKRSIYTNVGS